MPSNGSRPVPVSPSAALRFEYAQLPPHEGETVTGPGQIGVAFSGHDRVRYRVDGRVGAATYPGGSVVCTGDEPIIWSDVREATEALEIYPDPALMDTALDGRGASWPVGRARVGVQDPTVLGIASVLRRAHVSESPLPELALSELAHRLAEHLVATYAGRRPRDSRPTRLTRRQLCVVHDLIEADPSAVISLQQLAESVHLSSFHFARAFRASVGLSPYRFVTSRRMDHARERLRTTTMTVEQIAYDVGFANVGQFRRQFVAHCGLGPAAYREELGQPAARSRARSVSARSPCS